MERLDLNANQFIRNKNLKFLFNQCNHYFKQLNAIEPSKVS